MAAAKRVVARKSPMSRAHPLSSQQDDSSSDDEEDREFRLESSDEEEEEEEQRRHNGRSSPLDLNARLKSTDYINTTTTTTSEDEDEHDDDDDEQHQQQETNIQGNLYINGENEQEDENGEDDEHEDDDKTTRTTTTTTTEEYASNEQSILIDSEIVNLAPIQQLFHLFPTEAIQTLLKHMGSDESDIDGVNSDTNEYLESFLESPTSEQLNISTMVDGHKMMLMNRLEVLCFMRGINCWRHLLFLNKTNVRCLFYDMKQYSRMPSSIHSPFVNLYEMYALDLDEASSGSGDGMDRQDPWAFALQRLMLDHYRIGDLDQLLCECCSIDSLRHLLHSFNLSWMRQHSIVDSDYEDDDVNMSDHQIKTQLIALLLLYVLVIGLKDILSQMSVVFLLELNQFCQLHTSKADKKEQLVNQLLYMAFPNIDPRPSIDDTVTVNDLMASYKMPELVKLCDTRGLAVNGTKIELAERLYAYCHHLPQPGKKKLKNKTTPKKKSKSPSRKRKAQQESEEDEPKPRVRRRRQSKRRRSSVSSTTSSDE